MEHILLPIQQWYEGGQMTPGPPGSAGPVDTHIWPGTNLVHWNVATGTLGELVTHGSVWSNPLPCVSYHNCDQPSALSHLTCDPLYWNRVEKESIVSLLKDSEIFKLSR